MAKKKKPWQKECPQCDTLNHNAQVSCRSCGYAFSEGRKKKAAAKKAAPAETNSGGRPPSLKQMMKARRKEVMETQAALAEELEHLDALID